MDFAILIREISLELKSVTEKLSLIGNSESLEESCVKINDLENKMDSLFDESISALFREEKDAIELIKIKEIISMLEKVADASERVSELVKSIKIKVI